MTDEHTVGRRRAADVELATANLAVDADPLDRLLGQVVNLGAISNATNHYFAVRPVLPGGVEAEGSPGTFSADASLTAFVLVIGSAVPVAGDLLVACSLAGRWIAWTSRPRSSGVGITGCGCPDTPSTITISSSEPTSNYGIFQNSSVTFQPLPTVFAPLAIGPEAYLSWPTGYIDELTGDTFYYYVTCVGNYFTLTRVYAVSVYGSPFLDQVRYEWRIDDAGNYCSPFLMAAGQIFAGGDAACVVTLSA